MQEVINSIVLSCFRILSELNDNVIGVHDLAAMTGIQGVSSSQWLPMIQSASEKTLPFEGIKALTWNISEIYLISDNKAIKIAMKPKYCNVVYF